MKRGKLLAIIVLLLMFEALCFTITPASYAEPVGMLQVAAIDRDGWYTSECTHEPDGWITLISSFPCHDDCLYISWAVEMCKYYSVEIYRDGNPVPTFSLYNYHQMSGVSFSRLWEKFGAINQVHVWGGDKATGYSMVEFTLPKPVSEFPIFPTPPQIEVAIDIKPGSYPNSINLGSNGVIPVAILSSTDFDATQVDPVTVTLAGAGVAVKGKGNNYLAHNEDINGDSRLDLVLQVITQNLDPGQFQDGSAVLTGLTYEGKPIKGIDEIVIVPPQ